eukprot:3819274-Rhodomonas_salina.3
MTWAPCPVAILPCSVSLRPFMDAALTQKWRQQSVDDRCHVIGTQSARPHPEMHPPPPQIKCKITQSGSVIP